ncbi:MAG: tRNA pseudouridine(38-40) synthase TruA [Bacteroidetes bacterium]|nr:tRNA pseudouridine(38-40) synthase TruA [Bacteroidota bacterium]
MKRNIKLTIEYDGTDFVGWQRQPNGRTVQEELEKAIAVITREQCAVTGAGRTDSGVHARGQVANFMTTSTVGAQELSRSLNGLLPEDIVVHSAEQVEEGFSARYSAVSRHYRYFIAVRPTALERKYTWELHYALDVDAMNHAASSILGTHDFQAFCKAESEVDHHLCNVMESCWQRTDRHMIYSVQANRFLHGMVRALVGTMVNIGRGYTPVEDFQSILASRRRSQAGQAAPSKGLFLERVTY